MRIQIIVETQRIPVSYHFLFVSIIKKSLSVTSNHIVNDLYTYEGKSNKRAKNFTFSVYMDGYTKKGDEFLIEGNIKWIISSSDPEFMMYLYNGVMTQRSFQYKDYNLLVKKVNLIPEKVIMKETILCKTMSPIHIKNEMGKVLSPFDEEFHDTLQYICNQTVQNATGRSIQKTILLTPIEMKKVIVKQKHDAFKLLNNESTLYVEAYRGTFKLEGHIQDLQTLYQIGLGMRRSQGFGNIEVIQG
ncbi:CRISPR-associated endoribonuclease Cas6 [Bacillus cereus]|uniref:CRISPR-associated endoribonuclease Cas6 n=1 Tax=Bacillus cereus TaxID=1396 RepID=UPI00356E04CA